MKIQLIQVPSDIGARETGAGMGIEALKVAALKFKSDYFMQHNSISVDTKNHEVFSEVTSRFAKRIDAITKVCENVRDVVAETLVRGESYPIILAGDHSTAAGSIAGVRKANPNKRIGVIWVDAHADLHSPYTTPSGNLHGMPLSVAIADDNKERTINNVSNDTVQKWEALKNIAGVTPMVNAEDIIFIGVRDTEEPEDFIVDKHHIRNIKVTEVKEKGVKAAATEALQYLSACDLIYLSFDVDAMCSSISVGTGTPVANGINEIEAKKLMVYLLADERICCFEIVEINPTLDNKGNLMAENAFVILDKSTDVIKRR
jgi:arginase